MRKLKFRNGDEMPAFGLGTWKSKPGEVYNAVKTAIKEGYRHIDCAPVYGNEKEVGDALSECISEGIVSRKDLWVTSKLWSNAHAKEDVIPALKRTLQDLQLDYLDLYLIHWPIALKKDVLFVGKANDLIALEDLPNEITWEGMEEAVGLGLVNHIGVSNFGKKALQKLIDNSKIKPEMNQVESHPYFQQDDLLAFCKANGVHFTAYAPLGSSDRAEKFRTKNDPVLLDDPVIENIAKSNNVTPGQILISWALHRDTVVIPKSVNPSRIVQNLQAASINLSDEAMQKIEALDKNRRYLTGEHWVFEDGAYTLEGIWA